VLLYKITLELNKDKIETYIKSIVEDYIKSSLNYSLNKVNSKNLLKIEKDEIDVRADKINETINIIKKDTYNYLKERFNNKKYMIINIPLDNLSKNKITGENKSIPLKLNYFIDSKINTKTVIKPYGINNTYVEIKLDIIVSFKVTSNSINEKIKYRREYPLIIKLISEKTPNYYSE